MGSGRSTPAQPVVQYALGALHALQATGQIDDASAALWHKRFQPDADIATLKAPPPSIASELESSAEPVGILDNEPEADDFDESTFVASISGPDQYIQTEAGRLRITGIEIYVGGILVHWLFRLAPHLRAIGRTSRFPFLLSDQQRADQIIAQAIPHFKVKDSEGTQYIESQSLWVGSGTLHGDARFLPGVSPSASGLQFEGRGWNVKVALLPRKAD